MKNLADWDQRSSEYLAGFGRWISARASVTRAHSWNSSGRACGVETGAAQPETLL